MPVSPPDLERWLCDFLRSRFPEVSVGNKEPTDLGAVLPLSKPLIVVRDDGGPREGWTLFRRTVGVSVLAGTRISDVAANELARRVAALLSDDSICEVPGSPVTRVEWSGCLGPLAVPERVDVARRYLTVEYVVAAVGF